MAGEHWGDGRVTITGDDIDRFRWVTVKNALGFEVNTGIMIKGRSVLPVANQVVEQFAYQPAPI